MSTYLPTLFATEYTMTLLDTEPRKCKRSDGRWSVWYRLEYAGGGVAQDSKAFWLKRDAIAWIQDNSK